MKKIRKCILCGKEYEYCNKCSGNGKPRWMSLYDTENCKKIFDVASDYYGGDTAKELKAQLAECDLKDLDSYSEDIKVAIAAIKAMSTRTTKKKEITSEAISEAISIETISE